MMVKRLMRVLTIVVIVMSLVACVKEKTFQYQLKTEGIFNISEELSVESIEEGIVVVRHEFPWEANSLVIEMNNSDIVLVDTPYTYDSTKELIEWIRDLVGTDRNIVAINTGFHFDNLGGNGYLNEQEIKIYATAKTVELIHERGEQARELFLQWLEAPEYSKYYDVYMKLDYVEPTEVFSLNKDEEKILDFGNESLVLYYPGETHSPDNIVVYYPEKKILFGGCMIKELSSTDLGNTADANLAEWPISIERLSEKYDEEKVKYLIPGHGEVGDMQLLNKTLELLR